MQIISSVTRTVLESQTPVVEIKYIFDGTEEQDKTQSISTISRSGRSIVAGNVSPIGINFAKYWNKLKDNKTNLTRIGIIQLSIVRTGLDLWGSYAWDDLLWGADETIDLFTGRLESVNFRKETVDMNLRDKMAYMVETKIGSTEIPVNYYASAYNPADLVWDILTVYGELSAITDVSNPDIDYIRWAEWKRYMSGCAYSLKAKFTGQTIKNILDKISGLTNSSIFAEGNGKIVCQLWLGNQELREIESYDEDHFLEEPKLKFDRLKLTNKYVVYYGYNPVAETWAGSETREDATSQTNFGLNEETKNDTVVWHSDSTSAGLFGDRSLDLNKDPIDEVEMTLSPKAFPQQIADGIKLTHTLLEWTDQGCRIEKLSFNIKKGTIRMDGRLMDLFSFFVLDDTEYGILDDVNGLL